MELWKQKVEKDKTATIKKVGAVAQEEELSYFGQHSIRFLEHFRLQEELQERVVKVECKQEETAQLLNLNYQVSQ